MSDSFNLYEGDPIVGVVCLGYVGERIISLMARRFLCKGLDISIDRITCLKSEFNSVSCLTANESNIFRRTVFTTVWNDIADCDFYIVAAPTPVGNDNRPDISALMDICDSLGSILKKDDIVVFESTVAPGTTEELCVPILEERSGLILNSDFHVGYSPERINIGDREHDLEFVDKIISASSGEAMKRIEAVYGKVLKGRLVKASSIKVAEASKIYENTQRDVLIALANQMSDYCRAEGIDIREVTDCASTKWNFARVMPGLVGGHCIGVDPYYLIDRARGLDVDLPLVECSRKINEDKPAVVADRIMRYALSSGKRISGMKVLISGITYKPDTGDMRNSKALDVVRMLEGKFARLDCVDPFADKKDVAKSFGICLKDEAECIDEHYDLIVELVAHSSFRRESYSCDTYLQLPQLI